MNGRGVLFEQSPCCSLTSRLKVHYGGTDEAEWSTPCLSHHATVENEAFYKPNIQTNASFSRSHQEAEQNCEPMVTCCLLTEWFVSGMLAWSLYFPGRDSKRTRSLWCKPTKCKSVTISCCIGMELFVSSNSSFPFSFAISYKLCMLGVEVLYSSADRPASSSAGSLAPQ